MSLAHTDVPSHYDPVAVFAVVFDNGLLAGDLAPQLTCDEVNVLGGLLESAGHTDGARYWLRCHRDIDCAEPERH